MASSNPENQAPLVGWALARKLVLMGLAALLVGLPINGLLGYAILVLTAVAVFTGHVTSRLRPWIMALCIAIVALVGQLFLKVAPIEEGHNVFLPGGTNNALVSQLPPEVYRLMAAEFDAVYPPAKRCSVRQSSCWQNQAFPQGAFAFSNDGLLDRPLYSRRVTSIDFSDPVWLRLGFVNDARYNWLSGSSEMQRARRDGRFWMGLTRWHLTMPFFVMYRLPADFVGSDLCWRGDVIWEEGNDRFTLNHHTGWACRPIERGDAGRAIFGLAIRPDTLAMSLDPPVQIHLAQIVSRILPIVALAAFLAFLVRGRKRAMVLPLVLIGLSLVVIALDDASLIGGVRPFDGGDDGLVYDSFARLISQALRAGDIMGAIQGGEKVYFYGGPGLRYLLAINHFIFGETYLGYLSLILILPLAVFALFWRFLSPLWALAFGLCFVAVPFGVLFGTSFVQYESWASRGFADPAAATFAVCAAVALVGRYADGPGLRFAPAFAAGLLFALAVWVRPNLAPFAGTALGLAGLMALYARQWRRLIGLCLGFLPATGMALHNWYFGGVLVLFSSNAGMSELLVMPPSAYLAALAELAHLNLNGANLHRALLQLAQWLRGPSALYALIPFNVVAVALVIYVLARRRFDPWLRVIAAATLSQHGVALFYAATPRYHYVTWLMTFLVVAAWFYRDGARLLKARFPHVWEKAQSSPPVRRLADVLQHMAARMLPFSPH